ncbi:hypothetical protein ACFQGT_13705 [Natrialbaceae archaeon GCM10025810]|uniref:hypothetical protein n=1 Tax=Halovalidus salilacus TaxID=3075124 RepID=UPI00361C83D6
MNDEYGRTPSGPVRTSDHPGRPIRAHYHRFTLEASAHHLIVDPTNQDAWVLSDSVREVEP